MCLISVPNLKEIHPGESWLKVIALNWGKEEEEQDEKCKENWTILRNTYFKKYLANFLKIWHAKLCIWNLMQKHLRCKKRCGQVK